MNYALDDEIIQANPVTGLTRGLQLKTKDNREIEPMNREEVHLFLETCKQSYKDYYPLFLCALRTGMRLGEILGLRWGDIDWHSKFIEVRRSYKRGNMGPTKTGKTRRVDMSEQLIESLRSLYVETHKEALKKGTGKIQEAIFHHDGIPTAQNSVRYIFKRVLKTAGLREMRVHDLRHTYASLLLSDGASPVYVKEQLGHTSIQMTVDIYGHLIPSANRDAVNRLDAHPDAPYTHPEKTEKAQPSEITPHSHAMVPKPGFEPGQAYAH
ncbi:MAG: site-specific integrase [Deltaproteobacteria bacterium]|nr:site-specific integrase [Deltaproteobacteria bacterium]MBN2844661.1 site-specific integrase [Deltaproteobacteria bacterium]